MTTDENKEIISGLPTMCLLPAQTYNLIKGENTYTFKVPRKGRFEDIIDEDDEIGRENFQGEFVVYDDSGVFYPNTLTQVLLALKKYPNLKIERDNEFPIFVILYVSFLEEGFVHITGEPVKIQTEGQ